MPHSLTRRDFLGTAAATGIAMSTASAKAYAGILGANEKIVIGIIGTGGRGNDHAKAFGKRSDVDVGYLCDVDKGRVEKVAGVVSKLKDGRTPKTAID